MMPAAVLVACAFAVADWGPVRVDAEGVPLPPGVAARLGSTRFRFPGNPVDLRFTADGKLLVAATDRSLTVWDAATGLRVAAHTGFRRIEHLAPRADGSLAILAFRGESLCYLRIDPQTGRELERHALKDDHDDIVLAPDGTRIAQRTGGLVTVLDTATWKTVGDLRFSISDISPNQFQFSPDGRHLAAVFSNNWTEVREVATGNMPYAGLAEGLESTVQEVAFTADGKALLRLVYTEAKPYRLESINLKTEAVTALMTIAMPNERRGGLLASHDGRSVYFAAQREVARFDLAAKTQAAHHAVPHPAIVQRGTLSPDGSRIATATLAGGVHLYYATTLAVLPQSCDGIITQIERGRFAPGAKRLVLLRSNSFQVMDVSSGRIVGQYGELGDRCLDVSHDATLAAIATVHGITVREIPKNRVLAHIDWGEGNGSAPRVSFSRDGRSLLANGDSIFRTWALPSCKPLTSAPCAQQEWFSSPDGSWAVSLRQVRFLGEMDEFSFQAVDPRSGKTLHRVNETDRCIGTPKIHPIQPYALFPTAERTAGMYDFSEARFIWNRPRFGSGIESSVFSPDGRTIAIRSRRSMQFLEAATGRLRFSIPTLESQRPIAFSPDGKHLAAIGPTAPLYLWDVRGALKNYPANLDRPTTEALWKDLLADDAEAAFRALRRLAAAPATTLPFVRATTRPAVAPAKDTVEAWIKALDAPAFRDREAAMKELKTNADTVAVELRAARDATPSPEAHERLTKLLATLYPETPESVRRTRIVELVEWCGTPAATALLREWSAGAKGSLLTAEAAAALARLR